MSLGELRPVAGRPGLWLHADVAAWRDGIPSWSGEAMTSHGRGAPRRVQLGGVVAIVRVLRRGGLLRALLPDAFASEARAIAEVRALERLAPLGLAPRCLGLEVSPRGGLKRLVLAVEEVPGARNLIELAADGERDEVGLARAAGRLVREMHDAGVAHADLNAANILARRDAVAWRAWVVDLDGAGVLAGAVPETRRIREVLRLCRSLDKWEASCGTGAAARVAFLREALPRGVVLSVLRQARRRHAWRARLGRTPR